MRGLTLTSYSKVLKQCNSPFVLTTSFSKGPSCLKRTVHRCIESPEPGVIYFRHPTPCCFFPRLRPIDLIISWRASAGRLVSSALTGLSWTDLRRLLLRFPPSNDTWCCGCWGQCHSQRTIAASVLCIGHRILGSAPMTLGRNIKRLWVFFKVLILIVGLRNYGVRSVTP